MWQGVLKGLIGKRISQVASTGRLSSTGSEPSRPSRSLESFCNSSQIPGTIDYS